MPFAETWRDLGMIILSKLEKQILGTSLVVQWRGLPTPNAGGLGLIPGQGTRSHMQQLRASATK